jgi:hypothetical protein
MSSRALRALREEREEAAARAASLLSADEGEDDDDDDDDEDRIDGSDDDENGDDDDYNAGGRRGFMSILMDDESSSSGEEDEAGRNGDNDDARKHALATITASSRAKTRGGVGKKIQSEDVNDENIEGKEEDLDAILFEMNIKNERGEYPTTAAVTSSGHHTSLRALLLGFDVQDLDLDHAMRSLIGVGGVMAAGGGGGVGGIAAIGDDGFGMPQQQQRRGRGGNGGGRRYHALPRKFLFGRPRPEWGKPPSFVGGGLGTVEIKTGEEGSREEEGRAWSVPWPYDSIIGCGIKKDNGDGTDKEGCIDGDGSRDECAATATPTIASNQRWFTLRMSDTYQEDNLVYQDLLSSSSSSSSRQNGGGGGLHDPNLLAMFVTDHPHFVETVLQLAMVLYYVNDRARGHDLLRRCIFLYESALPASVLPGGGGGVGEGDGDCGEVLIDINLNQLNSGYFAALFRVMQTSGMSGWYDNALATGRYLLSLDPQRDPMGVLLILDFYALANRRRNRRRNGRSTTAIATVEVEVGAAFIADLIESNMININHMDPLTGRHLRCRLKDMPNWAFSYALALYRLHEDGLSYDEYPLVVEDEDPRRGRAAVDDALIQALSRFPGVLPELLVAMNIVESNVPGQYSFRSGSSSMDWSTVLPFFNGVTNNHYNSADDRIARASGEHLTSIFVKKCHNLWKDEGVLRWLYECAVKVALGEHNSCKQQQQQQQQLKTSLAVNMSDVSVGGLHEEKDGNPNVHTSIAAEGKGTLPPLPLHVMPSFSPALARYAQCDPSEYEEAFRTFPPEAIGLNPNILAPAMVAIDPNNVGRRRFFRQGRQQPQHRNDDEELGEGGHNVVDVLRRMLPEDEVLDPDSPLLQLYLQSLLPWAHVEGVRPPPRG